MKHRQKCVLAVVDKYFLPFGGARAGRQDHHPGGNPRRSGVDSNHQRTGRPRSVWPRIKTLSRNSPRIQRRQSLDPGDWQISQAYQSAGDLAKALAFGEKALADRRVTSQTIPSRRPTSLNR